MEQIVVKTEVQSNGEILLYYVDENGENQEGVLTTIENIENGSVQIQDNSYMLENYGDLVDAPSLEAQIEELPEPWFDEDTKRLLIFYNDNKPSFVSGATQKKHLWAVACKTMLIGKNQQECEDKLSELKAKYREIHGYIQKGVYVKWPFLDLCHQAFHDDTSFMEIITDTPALPVIKEASSPKIAVLKQETIKEKDSILSIKQINTKSPDENVEEMLNLYLKYKESFQKEHWRRDLWDKIAAEMGEEDSEYLQKRFLNHKQHYISMLVKQKNQDSSVITWPYMDLFNKIYDDDPAFHKKYFNKAPEVLVDYSTPEHEWDDTQRTVLAKYYYDCYEEFEDETIPNLFLWTEVGRLIEKKPETCKIRYDMLHKEHLEAYILGDYKISDRLPVSIIFDHIISRDVKTIFSKLDVKEDDEESSKSEQMDELVQFFYDNTELFKDKICHFVCWAAVAQKLKKGLEICKKQWDELVILYKCILDEKKEDPDLQIDWRYIELFDLIFDYGMDSELLNGYDISTPKTLQPGANMAVKKVKIKLEKNEGKEDRDAPSKTDEPDTTQDSTEPRTDPRSTKILDYYLKNKDKFQHTRYKLSMWDPLAKLIDLNATECAHRFRTLKQMYIENIQSEIDKPRIPITWPYYALCKKVFGYRIIKNKLKQGVLEPEPKKGDWLAREIKLLISFFSKNFHEINNKIDDISKWGPLATQLEKSTAECKEKFVDLRKCYRKLKTMKTRNPDVKISWSYFNIFDRIYNIKEGEPMEVEALEEEHLEMDGLEEGGDEEYECIIVLQDEQEQVDEKPEVLDNAELIQQISELPQQLSEMPEQLSEMPEQLSEMSEQLSEMTKQLSEMPEQLSEMPQQLSVMPQQLSEIPEQLSKLPQLDESITYTALKTSKWTKRNKKRLLIFYINYIRLYKGREINPKEMWAEIATKIPNKTPGNCRKMLTKMRNAYRQANEVAKTNSPFSFLLEKVLELKPRFAKSDNKHQEKIYKDVAMSANKVNMALHYYLEHMEEFVNPRFERKYLWTQLANHISEPITKVYNKVNYLKQAYNIETEEIAGLKTEFSAILKEIIAKEVAVKMVLDVNPNIDLNDLEDTWTDDETELLMFWYLSNLDKFKNPKFNRSYLWMEASTILNKSPLGCSKNMSEIRTQYRNMVRRNDDGLANWRFYELCQKIYGTGRKSSSAEVI